MSSPPVDGSASSHLFRHVLARFASGVTVVTVDAGGERAGFTASSFASLSLEPPLVLLCAARRLDALGLIERGQRFGVSILGVQQRELGLRFAGLLPGVDDRFAGVPLVAGRSGSPWLAGCLAWIDCRLWRLYDGGDHAIVVGEVLEAALGEAGEPLGYFERHWQRLSRLEPPAVASADARLLLRAVSPRLQADEFVFVGVRGALPDGAVPVVVFEEAEGASAILSRRDAERGGLPYHGVFRQITLEVDSDLHVVGLVAAVSDALARAGIACNVVSALRHDHLFVPAADAERALATLRGLQAAARAGAP